MNLLDVVRILKGLSKEDRGRCMRSAEIDEELSSLSGENSAGAAFRRFSFYFCNGFDTVWVMTRALEIFSLPF